MHDYIGGNFLLWLSVAYVGFPAPWDKVSFCDPTSRFMGV